MLDKLAKQTGFCKRKRKLTPRVYLEMLLCKTFSNSEESLLDHVRELQLSHNLNITKQSIDEHFSDKAVEFLKKLISQQLTRNIEVSSDLIKTFPNIFIQDSTRFKLPDHLKEDYKGFGLTGMDSGATIQLSYDLSSHSFASVELTPATYNDSLKAIENNWIKKGSLVLRDLGYYKTQGLKEIMEKGAFYISKAKPRSNFYDQEGKKIDIRKVSKELKKTGVKYLSKDLFIDRNERLPVRAVFCKVPQQVYEKRIREKNKKGKSRGWSMTDEFRLWCSFNIYITNLPKEMISDEQLLNIYKLRWQVELVFKTWKSHYHIHRFKRIKKERIEVYIYATLLLIMIHWKIFSWLQQQWKRREIYISLYKFSKYMKQVSFYFSEAVILNKKSIMRFICEYIVTDVSYLEKEKKSKKLSFSDIVHS